MEKHENHYTVCILLTEGLNQALLVRKNRTAFTGMLNGPGGAIEPGEAPYDGAMREIYEETGLEPDDFRSLGLVRLAKLGELHVPVDCKADDGSGCALHYYAGAIKQASCRQIRHAEEMLEWRPVDEIVKSGTDSKEYAGNGDLAYFTAAAVRTLKLFMPEHAQPKAALNDLAAETARARGRLDECFRNGDLLQASREAAEIARLAYAGWYVASHGHPLPADGIV